MSSWIRPTRRCLAVEPLKLKRTLAPVLAVALPAIPGALTLILTLQDSGAQATGLHAAGMFLLGAFSIWSFLLLPLFIAIECSLVAGVEHQSHGWRRLFSLPVPRSSVYLAKFATTLTLLAIGFVVVLAGTAAALRIAAMMRPDAGLDGPFPWSQGLRITGLTFLASLFLLAVHGYVSLRWSSFSLNISLAIVGVVIALGLNDSWLIWLYPWSLPQKVQSVVVGDAFGWGAKHAISRVHWALLEGGGAAALLFVLGGRALTRRDVA